ELVPLTLAADLKKRVTGARVKVEHRLREHRVRWKRHLNTRIKRGALRAARFGRQNGDALTQVVDAHAVHRLLAVRLEREHGVGAPNRANWSAVVARGCAVQVVHG